MVRGKYIHLPITCKLGVNQQRGKATLEECADALNIWAPDGFLEQRPGHTGVTSFPIIDSADKTATSTTKTLIYYDLSGTSYTTAAQANPATVFFLSSAPLEDSWFIGFATVNGEFDLQGAAGTALPGDRRLIGVDIEGHLKNSNAIRFSASYWNGTEFVPLRVIERAGDATQTGVYKVAPRHISEGDYTGGDYTPNMFCFCPPGDWATTTVSSTTAYFIRFSFKTADGSATALDSLTTLGNDTTDNHYISPQRNTMRGMFVGQFPSTKRYIAVSNSDTTVPSRVRWMMGSDFEFSDMVVPDYETLAYDDEAPATHAIVPQFGDGYIAYGGRVKKYKLREDWPQMASGVNQFATDAEQERRESFVGTDAIFDPEYVTTVGEVPGGKYIDYFDGRLWLAGLNDQPYTIRWSGALGYHNIWTSSAYDILMEDDNSPITGMKSLGEHMIVFKRDSIWMMVNFGQDANSGVTDYRGVKIVDGVGCVSHASIQKVRGKLIFLAEDGVYAFDGTANIQKISDRLNTTLSSLNLGRAQFSVSANWKTRHCYLLSAPIGSYDNNKTLVYDYRNNAWWIWDIPAALWMNDEGFGDEETLYFVDNHHCMHRMGVGNTDHGAAISSHVLTHRIGEDDNVRRTVRQVEVTSDNRATSLTVAVRSNDDSNSDSSGTLSLTDDSEAKYADSLTWPTGTVTTKYVLDRNRSRRIAFRKQGDWLQIKVSHSTHNTPMSIRTIDVGIAGSSGGRR